MPATKTTGHDRAPAWLAAAETDRQRDAASQLVWRHEQAKKHAARVNQTLANLGIEPTRSAYANAGGLVPALLLEPNPDAGHYGVHAGWNEESEQVALLVEDWEGEFTGLQHAQLLNRAGDILDARENGPKPEPAPRRDHYAEALRSIDSLRVDYIGADAAAVAEAVNGLTAAVLHLARVTQQTNARL